MAEGNMHLARTMRFARRGVECSNCAMSIAKVPLAGFLERGTGVSDVSRFLSS